MRLTGALLRAAVVASAFAAWVLARLVGPIVPMPVDWDYFSHASNQLFSGGWATSFTDPVLQSGPWQLGCVHLLNAIADSLNVNVRLVIFCAYAAVLTCVVLMQLRMILGSSSWGVRGRTIAVACAPALLVIAIRPEWTVGHPAEIAVPVLWLGAGRQAKSDRPLLAGLLIGVAAGFEVWGVLGVVVLADRRNLRAWGRVVIGLSVAVAVAYLPFAATGGLGMFSYQWSISGGTLVGLLLGGNHPFPWTARLLQAVIAVGGGGWIFYRLRHTPHATWLSLVACLQLRLLLDPLESTYYWLPIRFLLLVGIATAIGENKRLAALAALSLLSTGLPIAQGGQPGLVLVVLAITGVAVVTARLARPARFRHRIDARVLARAPRPFELVQEVHQDARARPLGWCQHTSGTVQGPRSDARFACASVRAALLVGPPPAFRAPQPPPSRPGPLCGPFGQTLDTTTAPAANCACRGAWGMVSVVLVGWLAAVDDFSIERRNELGNQ